jgi:ferritin-like metal-binding protein YciE
MVKLVYTHKDIVEYEITKELNSRLRAMCYKQLASETDPKQTEEQMEIVKEILKLLSKQKKSLRVTDIAGVKITKGVYSSLFPTDKSQKINEYSICTSNTTLEKLKSVPKNQTLVI